MPSPLRLKVQGDGRDQPTIATQITASVIATQNHVMNSTTCKRKAPLEEKERAGPSEPKGGNDTGRRSIDMKSGGQKEES